MTFESAELLNTIGTLYGEHPQQKLIFDRMDTLRWTTHIDQSSPQNMLLIGESGVGKTHLVRKYVVETKSNHVAAQDNIPVLYVHLPLPFSLRNFYVRIQESLGHTAPEAGRTTADIQRRTHAILAARNVEMIILDDAHHISLSRQTSMRQALDEMIHLSATANVALVLIGSEEMRGVTLNDIRFSRRFSVLALRRFEVVDEEFIAFLRSIEAQISPLRISLSDTPLSSLLHELSEGLIGILMPLIQLALRKLALENSFDRNATSQFVGTLFEARKQLFGDDEEPKVVL